MFQSVIVKLTAVCIMDCTYCYMFNQVDRTYTRVPRRMPLDTALRLLERICEHQPRGAAEPFSIVLHGGEPLLWPVACWAAFLDQVAQRRRDGWNLVVAVQTNLLRPLAPELRQLLRRHGVVLGISLDGPQAVNDAVRVDLRGRGTYDRVLANVRRLQDSGDGALIGGFLAVANPDLPPQAFLDWLRSLPVTKIDVLWPMEYHWRKPPWPLGGQGRYAAAPRSGQWFAELFGRWWALDDPTLQVRLFGNLLHLVLGGSGHVDVLVNDCYNMFVVNTDGRYEYPDYLRVAADGSAATPYTLEDTSLDSLSHDPLFARLLNLGAALPARCAACRHRALCGGGFLPGRSDAVRGISDRESVLCADQMYFFDAVANILHPALQKRGLHVSPAPRFAASASPAA